MKSILQSKPALLLFPILILAFILRVVFLDELALYGDELTMVYDSYSILKTGHDQTGEFLPLTFTMGAGRPAAYVYGSIPFVALFGPGVWGVRALSIVSGLGIVILMYFLGKKLFEEKVGLVAAFFTAISTWDLSLSRGGFEAHFALLLALLGTVLFLYAKNKPQLYLLSAIAFGLTLHTYPTYKLTLPLFLLTLAVFTTGVSKIFNSSKRYTTLALATGAVFVLLAISQSFTSGSEERFLNINIFSQTGINQQIIEKIEYERNASSIPASLLPVFHNRPLEYSRLFLASYLGNISWDFLFVRGDGNPRHNMAEFGQFYWAEFMLILFGVVFLWSKNKRKLYLLILWILLVPLATALLAQTHALRNSFMLPPVLLLSSVGFVNLFNNAKTKMVYRFLLVFLSILIAVQFSLALERMYFVSPLKSGKLWSDTAKRASLIALEKSNEYDTVFISDKIDNAEYAYMVYAKVDPLQVISQHGERLELCGYNFKKFDNVYIGDLFGIGAEQFFTSCYQGSYFYIGNPEKDKRFLSAAQILDRWDSSDDLIIKEKH